MLTELAQKYRQDHSKMHISPDKHIGEAHGDTQIVDSVAKLIFIIQNDKEVSPWKSTPPMSTGDLNEYISVSFVSTIQGTIPMEGKQHRMKPNL